MICLDNLFTGAEANIEHLKSNPLFEFVHHDVEFPYHTETLDEIYNFNSAYRSKSHKKCVSFLSGIGLAICKTVW